jgi:hypothetical protein
MDRRHVAMNKMLFTLTGARCASGSDNEYSPTAATLRGAPLSQTTRPFLTPHKVVAARLHYLCSHLCAAVRGDRICIPGKML